MLLDEFNTQTKKLCDLYNKQLNYEQMEFWYDSLKDKDIVIYRRAIGEYAKKNKYMPTISDILETMRNLKPLEQEEQKVVPCKNCKGSGYVMYIKDGYEYAALCNCQNAIGKEYNNQKSGYYIPKATDIFHVGGVKK